jgi:hypothetical protein
MSRDTTTKIEYRVVADWEGGRRYESGLFFHRESAENRYNALSRNPKILRVELELHVVRTSIEIIGRTIRK